ncbi:MAG: hypothetical protein GYB65_07385, partial [Chloroflexi bacterium]|nr:hypothetical protein [Chloroflexota bacterium]
MKQISRMWIAVFGVLAACSAYILLPAHPLQAQDDDALPVYCPYTDGAYYRANIFPRYEPAARRLTLVDWTTAETVQEIATDLDSTLIRAWSLDCRYLAVAIGPVESMDTVVFDTVTNARMGHVPDAHYQPHYVTWGPGNYLVVESRLGAVLWNVPTGTQFTLTDSFSQVTVRNFSRIR